MIFFENRPARRFEFETPVVQHTGMNNEYTCSNNNGVKICKKVLKIKMTYLKNVELVRLCKFSL